jgi:hypothetical protein
MREGLKSVRVNSVVTVAIPSRKLHGFSFKKNLLIFKSTPWDFDDAVRLTDTTSFLWTSSFVVKRFKNTTFRKHSRLPKRRVFKVSDNGQTPKK